jgi:hypothetical protein
MLNYPKINQFQPTKLPLMMLHVLFAQEELQLNIVNNLDIK